ncbi:hypothetical protein ACLB2K_063649 [Fragaria x ananassa]
MVQYKPKYISGPKEPHQKGNYTSVFFFFRIPFQRRQSSEQILAHRSEARLPPIAMESATARRSGGGLFEGLYRVIMRRNSVYVTFVIAGAFLGERAVDYGVHRLWEYNNVGKRYEDIPVLGQRPVEE